MLAINYLNAQVPERAPDESKRTFSPANIAKYHAKEVAGGVKDLMKIADENISSDDIKLSPDFSQKKMRYL